MPLWQGCVIGDQKRLGVLALYAPAGAKAQEACSFAYPLAVHVHTLAPASWFVPALQCGISVTQIVQSGFYSANGSPITLRELGQELGRVARHQRICWLSVRITALGCLDLPGDNDVPRAYPVAMAHAPTAHDC